MKKKYLGALVLAGIVLTVTPATAQAKTVKGATTYAKAKTVKMGTTTVKGKNSTDSIVKFKAPKTKVYKITMSNLRTTADRQIVSAYANFYASEINLLEFKQNKEKVRSLYLESKYSWSLNKNKKKITAYTYIPKRTAALKLKKGQTIRIKFWPSSTGGKKVTVSYKLNIR